MMPALRRAASMPGYGFGGIGLWAIVGSNLAQCWNVVSAFRYGRAAERSESRSEYDASLPMLITLPLRMLPCGGPAWNVPGAR